MFINNNLLILLIFLSDFRHEIWRRNRGWVQFHQPSGRCSHRLPPDHGSIRISETEDDSSQPVRTFCEHSFWNDWLHFIIMDWITLSVCVDSIITKLTVVDVHFDYFKNLPQINSDLNRSWIISCSDVPARESFTLTHSFVTRSAGERHMVACFASRQLSDVVGHRSVMVHE